MYGIGLGVEEVGGAQVRVARPEVRVDAGGRDPEGAARAGRIGLVQLDRALDVMERAANGRDHHVLGREIDLGVGAVELPGGHGVGASARIGPSGAGGPYVLLTWQPYPRYRCIVNDLIPNRNKV